MADYNKIKLNDGGWMPSMAFGTGTTYFNRPDAVSEGIFKAVESGFRLIDTAIMYGTEVGVGNGLTKILDDSLCKREDLFVTTKLAPNLYTIEEVVTMVDESLKKLQLDYIDLMMIHFPGNSDPNKDKEYKNDPDTNAEGRMEMWDALQTCQEKGKIKHIGISNFTRHHIEQLLKNPRCKVIPVVNQIEFNPYMMDQDILDVCKEHNIIVQSYGPIGSGTRKHANPEKENCNLLDDVKLKEIATKHECTAAQVCMGYAIAKGVGVVTKTEKEERMKENLQSTEIAGKLTKEDIQQIDQLNKTLRKFWDPYETA
jgi:diketogulonate reductase-like aldo/keto reductase